MIQKLRTTNVLRVGALIAALAFSAFSAAAAGTATDSGATAAASTAESNTTTQELNSSRHCWRKCGGSSSSSSSGGSSSGSSSGGSSSSSSSGGSSSSSSSGGSSSSSSSGGSSSSSSSSSSSGGSSSSSSGGTTTAALSISTQGNHFVDAHGNTLQVRGVNVSGLESGIIFSGGTNYWASSGFSGRPDFTKIAAWKANAVRLPLNEDSWLGGTVTGIPGNAISLNGPAYQAEVKATVQAANAAGLYVILDLHWTAPGTFAANTQNPFLNADNSINFWTSVAIAFQSNPAVMFEAFNEPFVCPASQGGVCSTPAGVNANALLANGGTQSYYIGLSSGTFGGSIQRVAHTYNTVGYQQVINAIRGTGATNVIICGGNNYDDDLTWWTSNPVTDPHNQLAASIHHYPGEYPNNAVTNPTGMDAMLAPIAANHPIIMTELGDEVGSNPAPFATPALAWLDSFGYSVLAWTWNPWGGANTLIENTSTYTPTAGLGVTYHDWVFNHK